METCSTRQDGIDAGVELSCLDTYGFWRYIQTFMLSAQSTITHGLNTKPANKIRPDVFTKVRDQELGYQQRSLYSVWDTNWYQYRYSKICDVYPPEDYGRMYYNILTDGSVDKHQKTYHWTSTKYEADSIFVDNISKPEDVGELSYKHVGGERYVLQRLDYIFTEDEWNPIYTIVDSYSPPADHEAEYCNGFKLFVRKYSFIESTETYEQHDYDFGYSEGSCGFTGYLFSGSTTAFDLSLDASFNGASLAYPVLRQHMIDSGVFVNTSDVGFRMLPDGSLDAFGGMYFSQEDILTFVARNNVLEMSMTNSVTTGSIVFNPDGTTDGQIIAYVNKSYEIVGQQDIYTIQDIKIISDGTNTLRLEINNGLDIETNGTIALTIT